LLEKIDANLIAKSRKPFLGFSDTTALQWMIYAATGFVTFTGPLAVEWDDLISSETRNLAWKILSGIDCGNLVDAFPDTALAEFELLKGSGEIDGILLPGNLAMNTTLCGTPYLPDMSGKILFIEDISEAPYRFDRMLFHLRNSGVLEKLSGLLIGDFGWSGDEAESKLLRQSVIDATDGYPYPVMINLPYGHGRERMTLPVGGLVRVKFDKHPSLKLMTRESSVLL
jgi:muramoyltetrapeptide carboxypeptidase